VGDGDHVVFLLRGDDVLVRPLKQTLRELRGSVPAREVEDGETIRWQVKQAVVRQVVSEHLFVETNLFPRYLTNDIPA
jgi:hypothetical protein